MTAPVRISALKRIAQSPAHYLHGLTERFDSPAMRLGRLVDVAVLGGPAPCVWPGERRGKAWADFAAAHAGEEIVTAAEHDAAQAVAAAVASSPLAAEWTTHPDRIVKRRLHWSALGRACSGEPDLVVPGVAVVDLKTTRSADPARFSRDAIRLAYHAQLAWYQAGAAENGQPCPRALILAVESRAPYPVTVLELSPRALDQGARLCRLWLERLLACEASGQWPAYAQSVVPLDLPGDDLPDLTFEGNE